MGSICHRQKARTTPLGCELETRVFTKTRVFRDVLKQVFKNNYSARVKDLSTPKRTQNGVSPHGHQHGDDSMLMIC